MSPRRNSIRQQLSTLNHQLREQDRRKDEFLATLSHELRNPLAPIRTAAKIIASPQLGTDTIEAGTNDHRAAGDAYGAAPR